MINNKRKISVIVPIYKAEKYLEECIKSIIRQTYQNIEIILVDDGSPDKCPEICDYYAKRDDRIRVIHKKNGGVISARTEGLTSATGDYVAFVDADDWIELDLYERIFSELDNLEPDMITFSNYYRNYENGHEVKARDSKKAGLWENKDLREQVIPYFINTETFFDTDFSPLIVLYILKREFANQYMIKINNNIRIMEDDVIILRCFLNANSLAAVPYAGYHYRYNIKSSVHTLTDPMESYRLVYAAMIEEVIKTNYNKDIVKKKCNFMIYHSFMMAAYDKLINISDEYLFPYSDVKRGSKIIIYGAGAIGKQLVKAVLKKKEYKLIGWLDRNWKSYRQQGFDVIDPTEIAKLEYDYIIIAISYANIKKSVIKSLLEMGVDLEKIAKIDLSILDEKHLPIEIRQNL